MKTLHFNAKLNLSASGKQRRFSILAYSGGLLPVEGFPVPVIVDLQGLDTSTSIPILIDHTATVENTLGLTDQIQNDGRSLTLSGPVTGVSVTARQVLDQSSAGHTWQASIGASVIEAQRIATGDSVTVNGQRFVGPVIVARRSVLKETSVLPMGADSTTSVNLAAKAALKESIKMSFEEFVVSLGLDVATLTPEASAALQIAFDTQASPNGNAPAPAAAQAVLNLKAASSKELRRQSEINAMCAGFPNIAAAAIENDWSPVEAQNHVLKARLNSMAPNNRSGISDRQGITKDTLSAGLMIRAGHEAAAVKAFGAQNCELARASRITNLVDLSAAALTLSGRDRSEFGSDNEMIRAAFSTTSLPTILSNTVGRTLTQAYEETTSVWRSFCHVADAQDFKTQTGVRPGAIATLEELGAGGNIKHGTLTEEDTYSWNVATYAKMLGITRQTVINDDLGFIAELAPMMGTAAGRTLNDLIWGVILGAQAAGFFASGNGNLATTSSALAVATLGAAVAAMRSQRDSQGHDINIQPAVLVVTPVLELTARALLNSNDMLGTSGPNGNPVKGIVKELIIEPRLSNSTRFSNTSATQWYLFGAPATRPVTVGFLRGATMPTVETADSDFNTLGIQLRVFHDFGAALSDEKAAYKATGQE